MLLMEPVTIAFRDIIQGNSNHPRIAFAVIIWTHFRLHRQGTVLCTLYTTSGFWPRVRARALHAPVFFSSLPHITGRCAPPPAHRSFAAYYLTPKIKQNLSNLGRPHPGLFSFHGTTEAMKYEVPCPCPTHRSFADPFGNTVF
jgi:hypothetical protein